MSRSLSQPSADHRTWLRRLCVLLMVGPGLVVAAYTVVHAIGHAGPAYVRVLSGFAVVGLLGPLAFGTYWLVTSDLRDDELARVAGWTLAGSAPIFVFAVVTLLYQRAHGVTIAEPVLILSWVAGVGATGGFLTGIYDFRRERQRREFRDLSGEFRALVAASPVALVGVDTSGTVTHWNDAAAELFGWEREAVLGEEYPLVPPDRREEHDRHRAWVTNGHVIDGVETERQTRDGSLVDVRLWSAPIEDADGETVGAMFALADISTRKQREQQLTVLRRVLRHNLSNAVTVIEGNAEWLAREVDGEREAGAARTIERTAADLGELGEKAREAERALTGEARRPVDLRDLFEREREAVGTRYPDADVTFDPPEEPLAVGGPALEIALREAIENAVEHGDRPAEVSVSAEQAPAADGGAGADGTDRRARISVADDGPGLPAHEREVIETGAETPLHHGTGLGLWLMDWLTRSIGGDLHVDADDGGTTVTFEVPVADGDDGYPYDDREQGGTTGPATGAGTGTDAGTPTFDG